jgi:uncharacterized protein (DUF1501 family)
MTRTHLNRRDFLQSASAASLVLGTPRLWAATGESSRVLIVFLRGGYDAVSVLVPHGNGGGFYAESRPNIAITRPSGGDGGGSGMATELNADWALAPALATSVLPRFQAGEVAFIPFAGTPDLSRSHFETQDSVELGQPLERSRGGDGFMNRLAQVLPAMKPMSFTDRVPLIFRGERMVSNIALANLRESAIDERQARLIERMYQGDAMADRVKEGFAMRTQVSRELMDEMENASRGAISAKGFETQARRIGKLMREDVRLGFVDVGGWDSHVGQGAATGQLAGRVQDLGAGLAGFAEAAGPAWKDTVVVVISEFGRTFRENGNRGTDHGHGSVYWVMGGKVRGGIKGEQVALSARSLNENRDYPVLNDYRDLIGGLFQRLYGLDTKQVQAVFPQSKPKDLGLI